jgi:hypothetical protein
MHLYMSCCRQITLLKNETQMTNIFAKKKRKRHGAMENKQVATTRTTRTLNRFAKNIVTTATGSAVSRFKRQGRIIRHQCQHRIKKNRNRYMPIASKEKETGKDGTQLPMSTELAAATTTTTSSTTSSSSSSQKTDADLARFIMDMSLEIWCGAFTMACGPMFHALFFLFSKNKELEEFGKMETVVAPPLKPVDLYQKIKSLDSNTSIGSCLVEGPGSTMWTSLLRQVAQMALVARGQIPVLLFDALVCFFSFFFLFSFPQHQRRIH